MSNNVEFDALVLKLRFESIKKQIDALQREIEVCDKLLQEMKTIIENRNE